jgi:hypothetical protein
MAKEAGEEGWYGCFAEIAYKVSRNQPYVTTGRDVARLEAVNMGNQVWTINNVFAEYQQFGNGRLPKRRPYCDWPASAVFSRNNVPVFVDPPENIPYYIFVFALNPVDQQGATRVFVQGTDPSGNTIYSLDGSNRVQGEFLTLASPFVSSTNVFQGLPTGIQKDVTQGALQFFWVNATTGVQILMLTMEPGETTASYRRYYFNALPQRCCPPPIPGAAPTDITVTAIAKLELIPVTTDTDYCLIQSQEAIINECEAIRYEGMDNPTSHGMADRKHKKAVQLLNGQLAHYLGIDNPAVSFKPFGSACHARETAGFI